jgi:hypothetical protein
MKKMEFRRMLLPDKNSPSSQKAWNSGGPDTEDIPSEIRPLIFSLEKRWVEALISELRSKQALDLDPSPTLERGLGVQPRAYRKVDFLVVSSSNAARLTKALNEAGYSVCKMIDNNWRINRDSCSKMATSMARHIANEDPGAVVLQILDGSMFYTRSPDGSRVLPKKSSDGRYHIEGELVVCSPDTQMEHFISMRTILDAIGKRPCIIITNHAQVHH